MLAVTTIIIASILLRVSGEKILLATDRGVLEFISDNSTISCLHPHPATSLDFRHNGNDLYFISNNDIYYSYYSEYLGQQSEPAQLISGVSTCGLAVDWMHYRLYFYNLATRTVLEAPLLQPPSGHVFTPNRDLEAISIDPYTRMLFCIENGRLVSVTLDGGQRREYVFDSLGIDRVDAMAVDPHEGRVLAAGQGILVATDYSNTRAWVLHREPILSSFLALAVVADRVVWAKKSEEGQFGLYACDLAPDCHPDNLTLLWESREAINEVKFHTALEQSASTRSACALRNCSYGCAEVSAYTVTCTCPKNLLLDPQNNTCTATPPAEDDDKTDTVEARLTSLGAAIVQHLESLKPQLVAAIFICCSIMLILLSCGFCLLQCHIHQQSEDSTHFLQEDTHSLDRIQITQLPSGLS